MGVKTGADSQAGLCLSEMLGDLMPEMFWDDRLMMDEAGLADP